MMSIVVGRNAAGKLGSKVRWAELGKYGSACRLCKSPKTINDSGKFDAIRLEHGSNSFDLYLFQINTYIYTMIYIHQ